MMPCAICKLQDNQIEQLKSQNQTLEKEVKLLKKVYEAAKECVVDWQVWDELEESVKAYEESRKVKC
jgi:hypothetical protein